MGIRLNKKKSEVDMSPTKENTITNNTTTNVERTANTAVSSNMLNQSEDDNETEDVFDYGSIKMLRRVENIN